MKQNVHRIVLCTGAVISFLSAAVFMGGCSKQETPEEKTVLTFSWWGDESIHRATLEAVKIYEEHHPEIKIKTEFQSEEGYFQRIATQMANGNLPDIFQYQNSWYEQTVKGALSVPINLKQVEIDFSGVEEYREISYPLATDGDILLVNKTFFEDYGIPVRDDYTWNQILKLGEHVQKQSPTAFLMQVSLDEINEQILPIHLVQQINGNMINQDGKLGFNSRQMTDTMELIRQLYDTGTIVKLSSEAMITNNIDKSERWKKGKIGMRLGTISTYVQLRNNQNFPVSFMPVPKSEGTVCSGIDYQAQSGLSISSSSPHQKEAAEFLQWFASSEEAAKILGLTRGIPANQNLKAFLIEEQIIDDEILDLEEIIETDSYIMNGTSKDEEFINLRKSVLIQMLEEKLLPKEAAWKIMEEWVGI